MYIRSRISDNSYTEPGARLFAAEVAHLIGFHSVNYSFPCVGKPTVSEDTLYFEIGTEQVGETVADDGFVVTKDKNKIYISPNGNEEAAYEWLDSNYESLMGTDKLNNKTIPEQYDAASDHPHKLNMRYGREEKGLEFLFERGFIFRDNDENGLNDELNAVFELPEDCSEDVWACSCDFALRFGMETTGTSYPLFGKGTESVNVITFAAGSTSEVSTVTFKEPVRINVTLGENCRAFSKAFCEQFPDANEEKTVLQITEHLKNSFALKNLDGQMAFLDSLGDDASGAVCGFSPKVEDKIDFLNSRWKDVKFEKSIGLEEVCRKEFDIPWEVDTAIDAVKEFAAELNPGDKVELFGALSEEKFVREKFVANVSDIIRKAGAELTDASVINAYKQGFSWLEEVIVPKLAGKSTEKLFVKFKPFLAPGVTDWGDVDGAYPSYNTQGGDPDHWFDLPLRYLQELFPVDDIIAPMLGISRDNIIFSIYDGDEDLTYDVSASDKSGDEILHSTYKARYSERPYLDQFPEMGVVHPSTGFICFSVNGKNVYEKRIKTDLENIWEVYQRDVLGYCRKFTDELCGGAPKADMQPFFAQIRLDISASEEDRLLGVRQDMISPLNALHEDIYFAGLDMFKVYGLNTTGANLDAPGLFLPVIRKGEGKPSFAMTHYRQRYSGTVVIKDGVNLAPKANPAEISVLADKITYAGGKLGISFTVKAPEKLAAASASLVQLSGEGATETAHLLSGYGSFGIASSLGTFTAALPGESDVKDLSIEDIDIMENTLIGYDQYLEIIGQLKRVPGIKVYKAGETYQGRDLYAIRLMPDYEGYISRTKLINSRPTDLINTRHHANEVSGTNGVFMVLKELLTNEKYWNLPDDVNIVMIPFENADGAAIHYELQKIFPTWQYHIARYNSLGKEFYRDYFDCDTIHTEALCIRDTYYRWLPDIYVDNHGVPSHEWEQQFSGYTSPWFKGFWLPRSLLYGYFFVADNEEYSANSRMNLAMRDVVTDSLMTDPEIQALNADWRDRHEKYAHKYMPKLFPADYYKSMINYWIPVPYNPNHGYKSIRFPWITGAHFVSEVLDETAQGDYLHLCARTQALHMLAEIDSLRNVISDYHEIREKGGNGCTVKMIRKRPFISAGMFEE